MSLLAACVQLRMAEPACACQLCAAFQEEHGVWPDLAPGEAIVHAALVQPAAAQLVDGGADEAAAAAAAAAYESGGCYESGGGGGFAGADSDDDDGIGGAATANVVQEQQQSGSAEGAVQAPAAVQGAAAGQAPPAHAPPPSPFSGPPSGPPEGGNAITWFRRLRKALTRNGGGERLHPDFPLTRTEATLSAVRLKTTKNMTAAQLVGVLARDRHNIPGGHKLPKSWDSCKALLGCSGQLFLEVDQCRNKNCGYIFFNYSDGSASSPPKAGSCITLDKCPLCFTSRYSLGADHLLSSAPCFLLLDFVFQLRAQFLRQNFGQHLVQQSLPPSEFTTSILETPLFDRAVSLATSVHFDYVIYLIDASDGIQRDRSLQSKPHSTTMVAYKVANILPENQAEWLLSVITKSGVAPYNMLAARLTAEQHRARGGAPVALGAKRQEPPVTQSDSDDY